jgi:hypothetical protein
MSNSAVTTYWLTCVGELPVMAPIVALDAGTVAGGTAGVALELSVKVTVRLFVPCGAEEGDTLWIPLVTIVWPKADAAIQPASKLMIRVFM